MRNWIRALIAAALLAGALPAPAQVTPASNYTDMWYLPSESGWGVSFTQHAGTNEVFAVWYTYDPRQPDPSAPGRFKPLWVVMPGGTWTTPTTITGEAFVTDGAPLGALNHLQKVGSFALSFQGTSTATFSYAIAPPAGLAPDNPAFGLPAFSGTRTLSRQPF
jgi:hypothetical protein